MFCTILTPLDGSTFAEQALPYALGIARRTGATLDLVHVHVLYALEEPYFGRYCYEPSVDEDHRRQEQLYLQGTAKWLAAVSPVPMTTAVIDGIQTEAILQRVKDHKANLIVMATHGRGPLGRLFLGGMADEIFRRAATPVLLVPPHDPPPGVIPEPLLERVLVPLDGSELAEQVLEPALTLVRSWEGSCTLLRVVETRNPSLPEKDLAAARMHLERIAERLCDEGMMVQTRIVVAEDAGEVILEEARTQHCHCIALATHGHGGLQRLLLGSCADKVVRGASIPVLVYRPAGTWKGQQPGEAPAIQRGVADELPVRRRASLSWSGLP